MRTWEEHYAWEEEIAEGERMMEIEREMFEYLLEVRDEGSINPLSAGPMLQEKFELSRGQAREVMIEWMKDPLKYKRMEDEGEVA